MRRTFAFDSLVCPTFQTTMRVVELAGAPALAREILAALGRPSEPLAVAPAGDPTWDQTDLAFDVA